MNKKDVGLMSNIGLLSLLKKHQLINTTQLDSFVDIDGFKFPMVSRVTSRMLATDLVNVQPLDRPTGMLFLTDEIRPNGYKCGRIGVHVNGINVLSDKFYLSRNGHTINVSQGERRLRATWSPEMAQDLRGFHNINAEEELTRILSEQLAQEVNRDVLNNINALGNNDTLWNVNNTISPVRSTLFS